MKQFIFLLTVLVLLASCSNEAVVEFPNGSRVTVDNPDNMYKVGDEVCVKSISSSYTFGTSHYISGNIWTDTTTFTTFSDSTYLFGEYRMGVMIK